MNTISARLCETAGKKVREYKCPLIAAAVAGFAAHGFVITNRLLNADDLSNYFGKGGELESGRWGLSLLSWVLPDFSMSWLWGLLTLALVTIAICLTVRIFEIRSKVLQMLLAGLIIVFPALTGTLTFMFTSSSYAVGMLCSVLAVYLLQTGRRRDAAMALVSLIFSLSIYQAYVSITAGFLLLLLFQAQLRDSEAPKQTFLRGMKYLMFLAAALILYYGITMALVRICSTPLSEYATDRMAGLNLKSVLSAYVRFFSYILFGLYGTACTIPTIIAQTLLSALAVISVIWSCVRKKNPGRTALLVACLALLPLAVNCMILISGKDAVHTLTTYGFISVYVLVSIVTETLMEEKPWGLRDAVALLMVVVVVSNIYVANKAYLQRKMCYENMFALCSSIVTQVKMTPGFDENSKLAIIGDLEAPEYLEKFGTGQSWFPRVTNRIFGVYGTLYQASKERFIEYFIGFDIPFATKEEVQMIQNDPQYEAMTLYPYDGSVQKIGDFIVVKMS